MRMWIDTDTASDDAVAILMALRWPGVQVEGISVVAGNVPVEMGARNARTVVELCGQQTPVYTGAEAPLLREPHWAFFFHGPDGMGGMNYPEPVQPVRPENGVLALIDAVRAAPGEITLVTLGPLTNIALALRLAPDIVGKIPVVYMMAGAANTVGNITPAAEYNIWFDPDAARAAYRSGLPLVMAGWELCRGEANLNAADIEHIRSFSTPYADLAIDSNRSAIATNQSWLGDPGLPLPDPVTMAIALDPAVCTRHSKHFVDVEVQSELTRGMTVVDELGVLKQPENVDVCWAIDAARFKEVLYSTLR